LLEQPTKSLASVQVAVNNVARTVTGGRRKDHVTVETLLERAKLPSVNRMVVKATALEAWSAFVSKGGGDGSRNAIGQMMFDNRSLRPSRLAAAGEVVVPSRGVETFVTRAAVLWNSCPEIRAAQSKGEAKSVADTLANNAPL
jgi:hypothetical protein